MTRKLKSLWLALGATFAIGAIVISAAPAEGDPVKKFHSEVEPTFLESDKTTDTVFTLSFPILCKDVRFDGTATTKTVDSTTLTPTYQDCTAFEENVVHIDPTGCDFQFTLKDAVISTGESTHTPGPVHIKCPQNKAIDITVTKKGSSDVFCTITVPEQTPTIGEFDYKNEKGAGGKDEERHVLFTSTISGLHYEVHGGLGLCGSATTTQNNGALDGSFTLKGYKDEAGKKGAQVGIWVNYEV